MEQLLNEDVKQTPPVKVEPPEETSHDGVLEVPESSYKEEMEEVMIGQEEKQLCVKEESSAAIFPVSTTSISNVTQMLLIKVEPLEEASVALEVPESSYKKEEVMEDCVKEESSSSSFPVSTTSINNVTQMLHVKVEPPEETSHGVVLDVPESSYKEEVMEAVIGQEEKQLCVKESSAASLPVSAASINNVMPVKVEVQSHGVVLDAPESSYKDEPEEFLIGQEENQHTVKEESSAPSFPVSTTSTNSEDDAQTPLSSCPTNGSNQQMTEGAGSTGNPNLDAGVDISNSLKTKLEVRLIRAVASHPELYDTRTHFYRVRNKKHLAWKKISKELGQPVKDCRKKWKSLRDTYLKEKKVDKEKRRWQFSGIMRFLDPFVTTRETRSNVAQVAGYSLPEDEGQPSPAAGESETEEPIGPEAGPSPALPASPVPGPSTSAAAAPTGLLKRKAPNRVRNGTQDGPSEVKRAIRDYLKRPSFLSHDEHFLLGLAPTLHSVPPETKDFVKFQMLKIILDHSTDVINLEPSEQSQQ